jgi:Glycosyl transferase family 2
MILKSTDDIQDVAAIITAMTDGEKAFLFETVVAVLADRTIGQVILCVAMGNTWVNALLAPMLADPRLEIVQLPMGSPGATRNQAIRHVRLPWVAYCDGDDVWCPDKTQIQRAYANATGSDFVGADHYLIDESGATKAYALATYIPMPSSWLVRSAIMRQHRFDESLPQGSDGEWWVRTTGLIRRSRCPEMLMRYRVRSGSVSSSTPSKQRKAKIIAMATVPIVSQLVLLLSWCIWRTTRRSWYVWLKSWDQQYPQHPVAVPIPVAMSHQPTTVSTGAKTPQPQW